MRPDQRISRDSNAQGSAIFKALYSYISCSKESIGIELRRVHILTGKFSRHPLRYRAFQLFFLVEARRPRTAPTSSRPPRLSLPGSASSRSVNAARTFARSDSLR